MEQFNLNWHTYNDHLKAMIQNLMHSNEKYAAVFMEMGLVKIKFTSWKTPTDLSEPGQMGDAGDYGTCPLNVRLQN